MSWPPNIHRDSTTPIHRQIRRAFTDAVRDGTLTPGDALPSARILASQLDVNRLTVLKALKSLSRAGLVRTEPGRGSWVATAHAGEQPERDERFFEGLVSESGTESLAGFRSALDDALSNDCLAFSAGFPPTDAIDVDQIRRTTRRLLSGPEAITYLGYTASQGSNRLRSAIRELLALRGLALDEPDRIVVTCGAQQALALSLEALVRPGQSVAIESPGYMGVIAACRFKGIPMVPVPVDRGGINPSRLESALRSEEIGAIYTVPSFQNPTGVTQGRRRRVRVLELARQHGATVIEDDAYSDLRFGGRRVPPIKSLPGGDAVVYIGSFSKSLAPGLRVGFLAASGEKAAAIHRLKEVHDINTGALSQAVVADLLVTGAYRRHAVRIRRLYRERRDAMVAALEANLPSSIRFTRPRGGMHLWVMLDRPVDTGQLRARALEQGVSFAPGALFFHDGRPSSSLRLNYSSHPPAEIGEGIRRLARCITQEGTP